MATPPLRHDLRPDPTDPTSAWYGGMDLVTSWESSGKHFGLFEFALACRPNQVVLRQPPTDLRDALPAHGRARRGHGGATGLAASGEHCLGLRRSRAEVKPSVHWLPELGQKLRA